MYEVKDNTLVPFNGKNIGGGKYQFKLVFPANIEDEYMLKLSGIGGSKIKMYQQEKMNFSEIEVHNYREAFLSIKELRKNFDIIKPLYIDIERNQILFSNANEYGVQRNVWIEFEKPELILYK